MRCLVLLSSIRVGAVPTIFGKRTGLVALCLFVFFGLSAVRMDACFFFFLSGRRST